MAHDLKSLTQKKIYIGTSSWKYAGWKNLVYNKQYTSEKQFNDTSLKEYALHYSTVGVDHTYYTWPSSKTFESYMEATPPHFKFGLKVTEKISVFHYPNLPRYGKSAGKDNEHFLDPELFAENFLNPLLPFHKKLGPIMFEFSQFYPGQVGRGSEFVERFQTFFNRVPHKDKFAFAIEMRNQSWLKPEYFKMMVENGISHVFNSWTRMPTLIEQNELSKDFKFPAIVSRVLLNPGVTYAKAVEAFSPYDRIQAPQPEVRLGASELILRALNAGTPAFVFVNNRCEGCAPRTIEGILERLKKSQTAG